MEGMSCDQLIEIIFKSLTHLRFNFSYNILRSKTDTFREHKAMMLKNLNLNLFD